MKWVVVGSSTTDCLGCVPSGDPGFLIGKHCFIRDQPAMNRISTQLQHDLC